MVGCLVSPHVGQAVFHSLGTPEEVEDSQILQHRFCGEHLRDGGGGSGEGKG